MYTVTIFQLIGRIRRESKFFFSEDYGGNLKATVNAAKGWRDANLPGASIEVRLIPGI